jgi:hypothetical protein
VLAYYVAMSEQRQRFDEAMKKVIEVKPGGRAGG